MTLPSLCSTNSTFLYRQPRTPVDFFGFVHAPYLSLFTTRKITFFARHDAAWMDKIEYDKGA